MINYVCLHIYTVYTYYIYIYMYMYIWIYVHAYPQYRCCLMFSWWFCSLPNLNHLILPLKLNWKTTKIMVTGDFAKPVKWIIPVCSTPRWPIFTNMTSPVDCGFLGVSTLHVAIEAHFCPAPQARPTCSPYASARSGPPSATKSENSHSKTLKCKVCKSCNFSTLSIFLWISVFVFGG